MQQRRRVRAALLTILVAALALTAGCGNRREPSIVSVIRTDVVRYQGLGESRPGDTSMVLLVLKVDGIGSQAFDSLPKGSAFIVAGAQQVPVVLAGSSMSVSSSGSVAHQSVELLAGVPRTMLRFTLHLGAHPPLDVVVSDTTVRPEVRRPE